MDWTALRISLSLGAGTIAILLPLGVWFGRLLAVRDFRGKLLVEALVTVPLVLPPTVLGFYLLVTFGSRSPLGQAFQAAVGQPLAFSFQGLLLASAIANIPFVVQPIQWLRVHPGRCARRRGLLWSDTVAGLYAHRA